MNIRIRKGEMKDIATLTAFLVRLFSIEKDFKTDPDRHRAGLRYLIEDCQRRAVFVAETEGTVIGMVTGQLVVSTAAGGYSVLMEDMFVVSAMRQKGVGSMLFRKILAWGSEHNALRVQLVADITNRGGLQFYRKAGLMRSRMMALYRRIEDGTDEGT
jgi:GNAT superfamily N-acetyltransferase